MSLLQKFADVLGFLLSDSGSDDAGDSAAGIAMEPDEVKAYRAGFDDPEEYAKTSHTHKLLNIGGRE